MAAHHEGYTTYLESERLSLVGTIVQALLTQVELYAALDPEDVMAMVADLVELAFDALLQGRGERLAARMQHELNLRVQQGLDLDQALHIPAILRACFRQVSFAAIAHHHADVIAGLHALEQIWDGLASQIGRFYHARLHRYAALVEHAPDGIALIDPDGRLLFVNRAFSAMTGATVSDHTLLDCVVAEDHERARAGATAVDHTGFWSGSLTLQHTSGSTFPAMVTTFRIQEPGQHLPVRGVIMRDITLQRQAAEEREQLQQQIIAAQEATLRELSTPLIPLADGLLAMPLVGSVDSRRAQQVIDMLLVGVSQSRAHTAILDITGVSVVDTQVAHALIRAAQSVRLLGARVVLTGIRPEVAQTLVGIGVDLREIETYSTLQAGIAAALRRRQHV